MRPAKRADRAVLESAESSWGRIFGIDGLSGRLPRSRNVSRSERGWETRYDTGARWQPSHGFLVLVSLQNSLHLFEQVRRRHLIPAAVIAHLVLKLSLTQGFFSEFILPENEPNLSTRVEFSGQTDSR